MDKSKRDRLAVRIVGLLGAVAEGPIAIGALVLIVLLVTFAFVGTMRRQSRAQTIGNTTMAAASSNAQASPRAKRFISLGSARVSRKQPRMPRAGLSTSQRCIPDSTERRPTCCSVSSVSYGSAPHRAR
jgi:hypothetical protein